MRTTGKSALVAGLILSFLGTNAMAFDRHHWQPKHSDLQVAQDVKRSSASDDLQYDRDRLREEVDSRIKHRRSTFSTQHANAESRTSQAKTAASQARDRASNAASQASGAASQAHDRASNAASQASSAASQAHDRASSAASGGHGNAGSAGGSHR
ncbi:hypothetical protein ACU8V1_25970 (plasmid) [Rhizobium leguminosarum]